MKPYAKIKISNGVDITFWKNEIEKNGKKFQVLKPSINKSWKNEKDEWEQRGFNLSMNDLYRFFSVLNDIKKLEDKFKEENKEEIVM